MKVSVQHKKKQDTTQLAAAERSVQLQIGGAIAFTLLAFALGFIVLPSVIALPESLPDRLAFALHAAAAPFAVLLVAILMVSTSRRKSLQDIHGSAYGPPSQQLAVKAAFLQNTLEQTVLLVGALLILATLLTDAYLVLLPVAAGLFVLGRIAFYLGYQKSSMYRAFGMGVSMLPAVFGYLWIAVLLLQKLF